MSFVDHVEKYKQTKVKETEEKYKDIIKKYIYDY